MKINVVESLIAYRKEKKLSVSDIERLTKIPKDRIYSWERGKGNPKSEDEKTILGLINGTTPNIGNSEDSSPPQITAKKEETNIDYKDKFIEAQSELIKLQKSQIEAHKSEQNTLQESVSQLMAKVEWLINNQKINSENVDKKIRNLQFGQAHQMAFSQYVGREILKRNQLEIEQVSDTIKRGLMATLEKMDS